MYDPKKILPTLLEPWNTRTAHQLRGNPTKEIRSYLPNPSARAGYDTRSIF